MGAPAQQPVYYDTDEGQYYTMKNEQGSQRFLNTLDNANSQNGAGAIFGNMFGNLASQSGMRNKDNPFYAANYANRNYLGNPYSSANPNRFITNAQATPYAELTNLFPSLNAGSMQGLISSPDGAMSGASRFLSSSNTQGK